MTRADLRVVRLPGRGSVLVGRAPAADVRLVDPLAAGRHLRLHVGDPFTVEDLASEQGTRVWDSLVAPGERHPVLPGEAINVGATVLMLRQRQPSPRLRRLWTRAELGGLLDNECLRSRRTGAPFAWVVIELGAADARPGGQGEGFVDLLTRLDQALPPPHLIGGLRLPRVEALLVGASDRQIDLHLRQLDLGLRLGGYDPRIGVARFPRHGCTGPSLRAAAERALLGASPGAWLDRHTPVAFAAQHLLQQPSIIFISGSRQD